ncbi:MAG TPA: TetR/AcrR family transcriptional regulator [Pseudonocardia sp.]|uniref:TetR/AcrR family transcriptional regulator n=1 Tax=Pseudonocardia sp. TaxID=60912 RepID=UPI002F3EF5A1
MSRASRADAARHHEELIEIASRRMREHGIDAVSVPGVMSEIGLTRGGFYKHFASKEALVTTAIEASFREMRDRIGQFAAQHSDDPAARRIAVLDWYLSAEHRDDPGSGCPSALASAVSQTDSDSAPRKAFVEGFYEALAINGVNQRGSNFDDREAAVVTEIMAMVGGLMMARAAAGSPLSDAILSAVRRTLA